MSNDQLDPRVDEDTVDPQRILLEVGGVSARVAAILGALQRAEIPLGQDDIAGAGHHSRHAQ